MSKNPETLIDYFRQFYLASIKNPIPNGAKILYYHFLGKWNEARRPERLTVSHSANRAETGLEKTTYYRSFNYLCANGWLISKRLRANVVQLSLNNKATVQGVSVPNSTSIQSSEWAHAMRAKTIDLEAETQPKVSQVSEATNERMAKLIDKIAASNILKSL